jgi:hypothetical protein
MTTRSIDTVPVANTPPGGYGDRLPPPILAGCVEALVDGAPDLRGWWETVAAFVDGRPTDAHPSIGHRQRIEQAGDRLVVTGGGIVHDMRCDGTVEHGVHDVAEFDKTTEITVVATYENGAHVLRPVGIPIEVRRWRDGPDMMWQYVGFTARLRRLGPPDTEPVQSDDGR